MLVDQLERAGVNVWDGGYQHASGTRMSRMVRLAACEARLFWHALRSRPDVVHGFLPLTNFMSAVTGRMAFVSRVVTSKRALNRHQDRRPAWKRLDRMANVLSDVVTANSQAVAADTNARDGYDIARIVVIPNGVDFSRLDGADRHRDEARRTIGAVAGRHRASAWSPISFHTRAIANCSMRSPGLRPAIPGQNCS